MESQIETLVNVSNILDLQNKLHTTSNKPIQQGGFVFGLLGAIFNVFKLVLKLLITLIIFLMKKFFMFYIRDKDGKLTWPYATYKDGLFWKFLGICLKVGFYLVVFALGGISVTIYGLIYLYTRLISEFTSKKQTED